MRHFTLRALILTAVLSSAAVACSDETAAESTPIAASALSRNTSPNVAPADAAQLAADNADFAVDLYKTLGKSSGFTGQNLFFSPHSISIALAMTYAGARGTTATEMASALHFTLPQEKLHNAFNALDLALASRGQDAKAADGNPFRLRVTNSIWGLNGMPFEKPFLDTIAVNYGAGIRLTEFVKAPEESRGAINGWVEKQTEERIKELLVKGSITDLTRMVLVNAVYFNAAWATPFQLEATKDGTFHGASGDVTAKFMAQTAEYAFARGEGFEAVTLPYDGQELDLVAIVPNAGTIDAFESTLDGKKLASITSSMTSGLVELQLPKFKIEGKSFSLKDSLKTLGMKAAFEDGPADFSGIVSPSVEKLHVDNVYHQAFVAVDENGTEAAAATAVVINAKSSAGPTEKTTITIDRPFLFAIKDRSTGALVFLGRVMQP